MEKRFFSHLRKYGGFAVKYLFFMLNLALLAGLSVKTVNLWIKDPFIFSDITEAFPDEPEFSPKSLAIKEFWMATCIETLLFLIGGFFCYELLIRPKTLRRTIVAPVTILFLWTAGESLDLFFPATEKARQIDACTSMNISWDVKQHKCRLIDLELRRFEQITTESGAPVPVSPASRQFRHSSSVGNK